MSSRNEQAAMLYQNISLTEPRLIHQFEKVILNFTKEIKQQNSEMENLALAIKRWETYTYKHSLASCEWRCARVMDVKQKCGASGFILFISISVSFKHGYFLCVDEKKVLGVKHEFSSRKGCGYQVKLIITFNGLSCVSHKSVIWSSWNCIALLRATSRWRINQSKVICIVLVGWVCSGYCMGVMLSLLSQSAGPGIHAAQWNGRGDGPAHSRRGEKNTRAGGTKLRHKSPLKSPNIPFWANFNIPGSRVCFSGVCVDKSDKQVAFVQLFPHVKQMWAAVYQITHPNADTPAGQLDSPTMRIPDMKRRKMELLDYAPACGVYFDMAGCICDEGFRDVYLGIHVG